MERRDELTDAILDWALDNGVAALSLRPLATALGASTYTLVYWFGSKDGVVAAALERAEDRQREMIVGWVEERGAVALGDLLRRYWSWSCSADGRRYVRLFVETAGLSQQAGGDAGNYVERAIEPWRQVIALAYEQAGRSPTDARREATVLFASIMGLQLDLAVSGDVARLTEAAEAVAASLDGLGELPLPAALAAAAG